MNSHKKALRVIKLFKHGGFLPPFYKGMHKGFLTRTIFFKCLNAKI